jgi:hypothetical protein
MENAVHGNHMDVGNPDFWPAAVGAANVETEISKIGSR